MRRTPALAILIVIASSAAAPALAADSDAPPGSPPNWLPNERWVNELWLPFDEERLPAVLGMTRGEVFSWIRNDGSHTLAQLAARKHVKVDALAARLVANRRNLSPAQRRRVRSYSRRVITQGHLAQHLLFHALHQTAIPERAGSIFGTPSARAYGRLRFAEVSPLDIGELHGVTRVEMRRRTSAALRDAQRRGIRAGVVTPKQARIQLDRQLGQIPRWLGQGRYNGPPRSIGGKPVGFVADFAKKPSITADGTQVIYDGYRAHIPAAERLGEIHVVGRRLGNLATFAVSPASDPRSRKPHAAYNAIVAPGGRFVAFETAESTYPLAKRVGAMSVLVRDLQTGRVQRVHDLGRPKRSPRRSAYNPTISADGQLVAFEATDAGVGGASPTNGVWLADRATRTQRLITTGGTGAAFRPNLAADGSAVAWTAAPPGADGRSEAFVKRLAGGAPQIVSRASGPQGAVADADAFDAVLSADGGVVAFASQAGNLGRGGRRARIYARDLRTAQTTVLSSDQHGPAGQPAVSGDGRYVAWTTRRVTRDGRLLARVWRHDRQTGRTELVSRRTGRAGARVGGASTQPALSADGTKVVFTATASVTGGKPAGLAGVYVRDLARGTTTLVSTHAANPSRRPGGGGLRAASARLSVTVSDQGLVCHLEGAGDAGLRDPPPRL